MKEISPELTNGWEKSSEEAAPTQCAWFRNGELLITVEQLDSKGLNGWRVTLGHSRYDPVVNDTWQRKEAAEARASELMLTYKEYVNPTTYTVEVELMRDSEADIGHLLRKGGFAVLENKDNQVIRSEIVEDN